MLIAKEAMMPYFLEYEIDWNDAERADIYRSCDLYLVNDEQEIGFFMFREGTEKIFLADIQVFKSHQNRGYGTKILKGAKEMASNKGYSQLWLKVFKSNPALNLYLRSGYVLEREEQFVHVLSTNT